jgi:hypothetical protein
MKFFQNYSWHILKYSRKSSYWISAVSMGTPADPKLTKGYYTMDSLGCMLVRECTKDVQRVETIATIADAHPSSDYSIIAGEFSRMLVALDRIGVGVFLADEKYFPVGHRGVLSYCKQQLLSE